MSDVGDLIQSTEVYECFDGNAVEVEIMLDYLGNQHITPRHIYSEVSLLFFTETFWPPDQPITDPAVYTISAAHVRPTDRARLVFGRS